MLVLPELRPSERSGVAPFHAMDVLADANRLKAKGVPVISLALGQPGAPASSHSLKAARDMLEHGVVSYTDAMGISPLRHKIAGHYRSAYGIVVDPAQVMVTTGSSAGFNLAFLVGFDAGARIAIAAPGYPAYRNIMKAMGLVPVEIDTGPEDNYVLTAERLAHEHAKQPLQGVLIASPANPTGTVTPRDELERLVQFADREGLLFISDEIYHGLVYGEAAASALEFSDRPLVINSFSKYYCMTGWRVGWLVLPKALTRATERVAQSLYISAPELSQVAAQAAFDAKQELDGVRAGYEINRAAMIERLPRLGFSGIAPIDGAFYTYAKLPEGYGTASEFARRVLHEAHVAITPGLDFDLLHGETTVRLSYAGSPASIAEALDRIAAFLRA
ncbi:aminotransferase class I/II-fold pyridoxal phosphate-dependent enzyme [Aureimonas fodinaquatilis]|uniref:aspartate transaminase n=1 Tax=Aureimonas fodinaquatilis TaxID=2565783 RepID=A0A5B0DY63_9HYPH|nr:aminotransferase class I/II-fold pyridoxal phosphate-dependent enzyme [Aureimonas fodinaquatilis]KAA0970149.1 aminotransferase class I/II-fold pyridoxal phosphate-dependent enzyme [Aureimonas fodinaquatilis]